MKALADLIPGDRAEVRSVRGRGAMRRRLLDLGFVPGTVVELELTAPFGGLRAYRLRSSVFALREAESSCVEIKLVGADEARSK